jgi:Ni/Fe-hydrogenase subunit HybB-like protein
MKLILSAYGFVHGVLALLFAAASLLLVGIAARNGYAAFADGFNEGAAQGLIQAIGIAAVAVVALQISQTILEEEVVREAHVSGPTRVRRFLSRFMVVVVVALAIEGLIGTFKALREDPSRLPFAASLIVAVALLLAGWGYFIRCNRDAEELEPEAMQEAKSEDRKLQK